MVDLPPRARRAATLLLSAAVVLTCAARLRYGIELSDEATYVALALRFARGDVPFVDEHYPPQSAALITWPFVRAYLWIHGGSDGVVLATRALYLGFTLLVAAGVAAALRPLVGLFAAALIALVCVAFCPFGIPNLSYNTLSSGAFTLGLYLALLPLLWGRSARWMVASGAAHALAIVALPSYALPIACFAVAACALAPAGARLRTLAHYAGGGVGTAALFLPWLARVDAETLRYASMHLHSENGLAQRLAFYSHQARVFVPMWVELGTLMLALAVAARVRARWLVLALLGAIPTLPLWTGRTTTALWYVAVLWVAGWVTWVAAPACRLHTRLFVAVWLPSLAAGLTTAFTSRNLLMNAGFGLLPGLLVELALGVSIAREHALRSGRLATSLAWAFPALALFFLLGYQLTPPCGESHVADLDTPVRSGPFAGLVTTAEKERFLAAFAADVAAVAREGGRIVAVDHCPAVYLLSDLRPGTSAIWQIPCTESWPADCEAVIRGDLDRHFGPGLVAVEVRRFPLGNGLWWDNWKGPVELRADPRFVCFVDRGDYSIWVPAE